MTNTIRFPILRRAPALAAVLAAAAAPVRAQVDTDLASATAQLQARLDESVEELARLRAQIAAEQVPLARRLNALEAELSAVRAEYQQAARVLDGRSLDLGNLGVQIKTRTEEATYLSNLLGDYVREFESRLHIAEKQRYGSAIEAARLAADNTGLDQEEVFAAQSDVLTRSLDRLEEALGGARFEGRAVDADGLVREGTFVLVGPAALFRSADGAVVGTAEQRLGSLEPTVLSFADPEDAAAAAAVVADGQGAFPLDPTLGDAHKIAATDEPFLEHVKKGGPVMVPIFAMAGAALVVALFKWLGMLFLRKPSQKRVNALLDAVAERDEEAARERVATMKGPLGKMLAAGVEHVREPRELIEEVMYETVLTTKLKLQRFLPFVAICAASAPLLGLLGTVTGIINTFKMITIFGSGDVKSLSGGISEALITTKFGLIVAIPSLLLHAFLSRRARRWVDRMEKTALAFANRVAASSDGTSGLRQVDVVAGANPDPELVRRQVNEILSDLMGPLVDERRDVELFRSKV